MSSNVYPIEKLTSDEINQWCLKNFFTQGEVVSDAPPPYSPPSQFNSSMPSVQPVIIEINREVPSSHWWEIMLLRLQMMSLQNQLHAMSLNQNASKPQQKKKSSKSDEEEKATNDKGNTLFWIFALLIVLPTAATLLSYGCLKLHKSCVNILNDRKVTSSLFRAAMILGGLIVGFLAGLLIGLAAAVPVVELLLLVIATPAILAGISAYIAKKIVQLWHYTPQKEAEKGATVYSATNPQKRRPDAAGIAHFQQISASYEEHSAPNGQQSTHLPADQARPALIKMMQYLKYQTELSRGLMSYIPGTTAYREMQYINMMAEEIVKGRAKQSLVRVEGQLTLFYAPKAGYNPGHEGRLGLAWTPGDSYNDHKWKLGKKRP